MRSAKKDKWRSDLGPILNEDNIPLEVPEWIDAHHYPKFSCRVWIMEAIRRLSEMPNPQVDMPKLMEEIFDIGIQNLKLVMDDRQPIIVTVALNLCC